jgi:hypothetical protein
VFAGACDFDRRVDDCLGRTNEYAGGAGPACQAGKEMAQNFGDDAWCSPIRFYPVDSPGLAQSMEVRKKDVVATMTQSFVLVAIVTVLWQFRPSPLVCLREGFNWGWLT